MQVVLVSHFHWDREWYRTFEAYRARLADAVDRVLELLEADPGYRFMLDGQSVVLEDYLAVRPSRREALAEGLRAGRLSTGPWYVQPDMLLPSGEALVRNLLHGRSVAAALGPVSTVAYVPDSFGHPAQAPQLFAGFGLTHFVYWRGNGNEIDRLGRRYRWRAADGSQVLACLLSEGYFHIACLPRDAGEAARGIAERLAADARGDRTVLLMNGFDHMLPDPHTGAVAAALAARTGAAVQRGLLEDALESDAGALPEFRGELVGARLANLLPGVWSTRMPIKLGNRRCEALLTGWLEPWAALGRILGAPCEQAALDLAWRDVLHNQAHDSLCGCSIDAVAAAVAARFAAAEDLAEQTLQRLLERLAGRGVERRTPASIEQTVTVFNPSPHARSDVVRLPLEAYPALTLPLGMPEFPPLTLASMEAAGFAVDGQPARVIASDDPRRPRWLPQQEAMDLEFIARDVPAFGCRRYRLTRCERIADTIDDGREIENAHVQVRAAADGTLTVQLGGHEFSGLFGVEDRGDRGDTYDFDPVDAGPRAVLRSVTCERRRHPAGLAALRITRVFELPSGLAADREERSAVTTPVTLVTDVRLAADLSRLDVDVMVDNRARDHRLRLLFPTGRACETFDAAVAFDVARRSTAPPDDRGWVHPAPRTFAHHGWVSANHLTVVAPGLPEAEVTADGTIALTALRAVGWLARFDLHSRPIPAGPVMAVEGAQEIGRTAARCALLAGCDPNAARDAELALRGVLGGPAPPLSDGAVLLALTPDTLVLSALKPAQRGDGIIVRVLNPTDRPQRASLRLGFPISGATSVKLDETPADHPVMVAPDGVSLDVPARALRSVLLGSTP
jgi:hypothetical protein